MKRRRLLCFLLVMCPLLLTGCWDRTELDHLAFELGVGLDLVKEGSYRGIAQFVIPTQSKGNQKGGEKSYFIQTAVGRSVVDAIENTQTKLSRQLFRGHLQNLYIGENLAKHGIKEIIDSYGRDPNSKLRIDIWIVKGRDALDVLRLPYPLESYPAIAASKMHESVGGAIGTSYLEFLMAASSEGSSPTLPVVEIIPQPFSPDLQGTEQSDLTPRETFRFAGRAIFDNNLKLLGYLNYEQSTDRVWILGKLRRITFSVPVPKYGGNAGVNVTRLKSKIITDIHPDNKVSIQVLLSGKSAVMENNTTLDLFQSANIKYLENSFNEQLEKRVLQTVTTVQKKYKADVFGFGTALNRQHPAKWKSLKQHWDKQFAQADVTVKVNLKIKEVGKIGPTLQLKESEIVK